MTTRTRSPRHYAPGRGPRDRTRERRPVRRPNRSSAGPPRARSVAALDRSLRALRLEVIEWGLAGGHPVGADAVSAVLATKAARAPEPMALFTEDVITELLWVDVHAWCAEHRIPAPPLVAATLHALIDLLAHERALVPGSDPVDVLHEAIDAAGGASIDQPAAGGDRADRALPVGLFARLDPA